MRGEKQLLLPKTGAGCCGYRNLLAPRRFLLSRFSWCREIGARQRSPPVLPLRSAMASGALRRRQLRQNLPDVRSVGWCRVALLPWRNTVIGDPESCGLSRCRCQAASAAALGAHPLSARESAGFKASIPQPLVEAEMAKEEKAPPSNHNNTPLAAVVAFLPPGTGSRSPVLSRKGVSSRVEGRFYLSRSFAISGFNERLGIEALNPALSRA